MKKVFYRLIVVIVFWSCARKDDYLNPRLPVDRRVESVISLMTLDEKLAILQIESDTSEMKGMSFGKLGFMKGSDPRTAAEQYNEVQRYLKTRTRFGIPGIKSGEGIFAYMDYKTTAFPQPLAQAASWDTSVVGTVARVVSEEMKSRGVRQVYAPVLNMGRDPRWGRTGETYGEDPFLVSQMGVAYCRVFSSKGMITCLKHFAGNTGHNGMFGAPVFYSERYYREYEFPPYEAAIREGKAKSIMMAYNTADGIPCPQHEWMMKKIIRGEWGFDGFIVSDGGGLSLIKQNFGIDSSEVQIVAKAINAGCDVGLDERIFYGEALKKAVQQGLVSEKTIDESVRRVLRQIFATGLYDNPYVDPVYAEKINDCAEHRKAALEVAKKTMVLLKNDNHTLPFSKNVKKVLVTGPLADRLLINHYAGWGRKTVTVLEGLKQLLPGAEIIHQPGAGLRFTFYPLMDKKYFYHEENGKVVPGLQAEYFANQRMEGTPVRIQVDSAIDFHWGDTAPAGLPHDNFSIRWTAKFKAPATGKYIFNSHADDGLTVYVDDQRVVDMTEGPENSLFTARGEIYLEKGREYQLRAEYIEKGGSAFAHLGWDADEYKFIAPAVAAARKADVIIVVVGMFDNENGDRATLELDDVQEKLILALAELNKPMAVVIQSGTVIAAYHWADKVPAILMAWYPGEEGGNAIARTLFGDNNPGGKLPITFPKVTGQVPLCYNLLPGRSNKFYDYGSEPLFCFGHGLSYTTFEYTNLRLSKKTMTSGEVLNVSVDIKNTGSVAGDEVVQLYLHDKYASVSRPVKELKGFKRISLAPGQTSTVSFKLTSAELSFWNKEMKKVVEPGEFELMIGSSSQDIRCRDVFFVTE